MVANPAGYGFINATGNAIGDGYTSLTGPGAYYLFWDPWDPTAKAHEVMADTVQQLILPVRISNLTSLNGSNRLDLANVPIGLNGFVDGRANVVSGNWTSATNINSTSATQTIFVPASGPQRFYRLRFPFAWSWP
jgi:phospholipase/lecithinase/hemolysin